MRRSKWTTWSAALIVGSLCVAACGGDDDDDASDPVATTEGSTDPATSAPPATSVTTDPATTGAPDTSAPGTTAMVETTSGPATGEPVKIMVIGSLEGLGLDFSQQVVGAEAAAAGINERGGVQGRPIEVLSCNDQFLVDEAEACARDAVSEGVVAVVGGFSAAGGDGYVSTLEDAGVPVVGVWALGFVPSSDVILNSPNSWPVAGGSGMSAIGAGTLAAELGAETINVVMRDDPTIGDLVQDGLDASGSTGQVAHVVSLPLGSADVSPIVAAAEEDDPDVIVIMHAAGESAKMIAGLRQAGSDAQIIVSSTSLTESTLSALGDDAEGVYFTAEFLPPSVGGDRIQRYLDEVDAINPDVPKDDFGQNAYAAVTAFAKVANTIDGEVTSETMIAALNSAGEIDLEIGPTIDFSKPRGPAPRMFNTSILFGSVDGGSLSLLDGEYVNIYES